MTSQHFSVSKVPSGLGPGSRLAGYLIEEQIGEGGMAVVYRAHEERLGRTVALKILAPALASEEGFRQRFVRESRAAAAVDHPHIIPIFEAGEADGVLFIAMRYVRGGDVRSLIAIRGSLPAERAMGIVSQVASALDAAYRRGLVHRDVKSANMLLDQPLAEGGRRADHVYLSDFGLSKAAMHATGLTGAGTFLGTLDYASPEQIEGRPVDGRADQYSLACAAYEMLCGSPPFRRDDAMALMYAQMHAVPPLLTSLRPVLPAVVDDVFARALAKSPGDRYGSCTQFADAVQVALAQAPEGAPTVDSPLPWRAAGRPPQVTPGTAGRAPTDVVAAAEGASGGRAGPAGQPSVGSVRVRRVPGRALLTGVSILAAAGLISGAILLRSPGRVASGTSGSSSSRHTASHGRPTSPKARSTSPAQADRARSGGQVPVSASYQFAGRLNPGPSTVSISSVAWNPAGPLVAASDKNGDTYVWNAATMAAHGPVLAGPDKAFYTAFSPNGSVIATGYENGSTYLWSTATGRLLASLHDPGSLAGKQVDSLAFSPDGRTLATSDGNGDTTLWNVGSPGSGVTRTASFADPAGAGVYSVAFGGNDVLATGDYDGHVYLWDVGSGVTTATFSVPGSSCTVSEICDAISGLAFSGDGSILAAASVNGNAELWSVAGNRATPIPTASQGRPAIWGMAFGGNRLGIACANGRLTLWRVNPRNLSAVLAASVTDPGSGGEGIGAVTFSADGHNLVTGDTNGSAYLWKLGAHSSAQAWSSSKLVITPRSLGAVSIGMTTTQASAAAGEKLAPVGDGVWYPGGISGSGGLSVLVTGGGETASCVSASDQPGVPAVVTPQGFALGGTLAHLKAVYRGRIRYVPAPTGGIMPLPGYVASFKDGNLVFWTRNGTTVDQIAGGAGVLPSTDCV